MTVRGTLLRGEMAVRGNRLICEAVDSWRQGSPVWELPLLNHLTGKLAEKPRRKIEIHGSRFEIQTFVSDFHQQGANSRDLYGSDLGVAVHLSEPSAIKYALFQLKVPGDLERYVDLRKDQLSAALDPEIEDRTFVVAVDRESGEPRVCSVQVLHKEFDHMKPKGRFEIANWATLEEWAHEWLQCRIGRESPFMKPGKYPPGTLERRIWMYELYYDEVELPQQYRKDLAYSPQRPIPARVFVRLYISPESSEEG